MPFRKYGYESSLFICKPDKILVGKGSEFDSKSAKS